MFRLFYKIRSVDDYIRCFENGDNLGGGSFGKIYRVVQRNNGDVVAAIKHLVLTGEDERKQQCIRQEV